MTIFTTLLWATAISFFASRIENCCCRRGLERSRVLTPLDFAVTICFIRTAWPPPIPEIVPRGRRSASSCVRCPRTAVLRPVETGLILMTECRPLVTPNHHQSSSLHYQAQRAISARPLLLDQDQYHIPRDKDPPK